jgi:hypothetical protein
MTRFQPRPWYVFGPACDEYRAVLANGGDLSVLKSLKILRSIIVNLATVGMTVFLVTRGVDPTLFGVLCFLFLSAYNGLEFSDYLALIQAYKEIQNDQ